MDQQIPMQTVGTDQAYSGSPEQATGQPIAQPPTPQPALAQAPPPQAREGLQWYTGKYIGIELANGKNEGVDKNGKAWKRFKLSFEAEPGDQYPKRFSVFSPLTEKSQIAVDDLVPGNVYTIAYAEKPFMSQYGPKVGKEVALIRMATQKDLENMVMQQTIQPTQAAPQPTTITQGFDQGVWMAFATAYAEATTDATDTNALHMLGSFCATNYPTQFAQAIVACRAHFAKPEQATQTQPPVQV